VVSTATLEKNARFKNTYKRKIRHICLRRGWSFQKWKLYDAGQLNPAMSGSCQADGHHLSQDPYHHNDMECWSQKKTAQLAKEMKKSYW
jgi:hypothetical protein